MRSTERTVRVEREGGVVTITLDRPASKNAMNWQLIAELGAALDDVAATGSDRAVVLTGAGDDFCAGGDLSDWYGPGSHPLHNFRYGQDLALRLHRLGKPSVATVRGVAVGAGCNLALGCDMTLAATGSRFGQVYPKRGLSVDFGGTWLLPRRVGLRRAYELAFFGDIVDAEGAHAIGLVDDVLPSDELDTAATDTASRLADERG